MKSFKSFKSSREKVDPLSRKMNQHQWEQAYEAYCSSRQRVSQSYSKDRFDTNKGNKPKSASHRPSALSSIGALRNEIRSISAYSEVRKIINLLCWIAIVLTSITTILKFLFYPGFDSQIIALLNGAGRVALLLLLKFISQILIDISDSSLFTRDKINDRNSI
ncbi:MAG: hypothetical protein VXX82_04525 [Verrucomicrobiota bacterium]|nr:hypothetical protein [Verrucomicrobiota bacterium]